MGRRAVTNTHAHQLVHTYTHACACTHTHIAQRAEAPWSEPRALPQQHACQQTGSDSTEPPGVTRGVRRTHTQTHSRALPHSVARSDTMSACLFAILAAETKKCYAPTRTPSQALCVSCVRACTPHAVQ